MAAARRQKSSVKPVTTVEGGREWEEPRLETQRREVGGPQRARAWESHVHVQCSSPQHSGCPGYAHLGRAAMYRFKGTPRMTHREGAGATPTESPLGVSTPHPAPLWIS